MLAMRIVGVIAQSLRSHDACKVFVDDLDLDVEIEFRVQGCGDRFGLGGL